MVLKEMVLSELGSSEDLMTKQMFIIERRHNGIPIRLLIAPVEGVSAKIIADSLEIAESTLSLWRKRFGMEGVRTIKSGPKPAQREG